MPIDDKGAMVTDPRMVATIAVPDAARGDAALGVLSRDQLVGRYRVVRLIAAGGMGEVYLALDEPLKREAALKVVRPGAFGLDSDHVARDRLLQEAQAMARVAHPNVVVVFEAGLVEGQVFIAMEYIAGATLRGWLEAAPRTWREILAMYLAAGRGLAALHAAGLVHRDFKPDNVLVGDDGRPRVGDLGLAASVADGDTISGGTPRYMAPEQYAPGVVDHRSDQFAFCVALWEALAGSAPFPASSVTELRAQVLAGIPIDVEGARPFPSWIRAVLRRGLARRSEDRYPDLDALLAALGRDPIVRRRRWLAGLALAGLLGLAVFGWARRADAPDPCSGMAQLLAGTWDPTVSMQMRLHFLATRRAHAPVTFEHLSAALDQYTTGWLAMREEVCLATAVRKDQSEAARDLRIQCLDRRMEEVAALTQLFARADDPTIVDRAIGSLNALRPIASCANPAQLAETPVPTEAQARAVPLLRKRLDAVTARALSGQYKQSLDEARAVQAAAVQLGYAPLAAEASFRLGTIDGDLRDVPAAEAHLHLAMDEAALAHDDTTMANAWRIFVSTALDNNRIPEAVERFEYAKAALARAGNPPILLAKLLVISSGAVDRAGNPADALAMTEQAIALLDSAHASELDRASAATNRSRVLRNLGRDAEALPELQKALVMVEHAVGPDNPSVGPTLLLLSSVEQRLDQLDAAARDARRALSIAEAAYGADGVITSRVVSNLCQILGQQHDFTQAIATCKRALANLEKQVGPSAVELVPTLVNLGNLATDSDDLDAAVGYRQRALAISEATLGPDHPNVAELLDEMAQVELARSNPEGGEHLARRAMAIFTAKHDPRTADAQGVVAQAELGEHHLDAALVDARLAMAGHESPQDLLADHVRIALVLEARTELAAAEQELGEAMPLVDTAADPTAGTPALTALGRIRLARGHAADAIDPLERVVKILAAQSFGKVELADAQFALAKALWEANRDHPRALELARSASTTFAHAGATPFRLQTKDQIAAWLDARR